MMATQGELFATGGRNCGHLVAEPGDRKTRCGLLAATVGTTWQRWAQAHIDGHGARYCAECTDGLDLAAIDKRKDGDP